MSGLRKRVPLPAGVLAGTASALLGVVTLTLAGPSQADPGGSDAAFLTALTVAGLTHASSDEAAVSAGRAVCQLIDSGMSATDTVAAVQSTNPGFNLDRAAKFTAISVSAYCPHRL